MLRKKTEAGIIQINSEMMDNNNLPRLKAIADKTCVDVGPGKMLQNALSSNNSSLLK